MNPFAPIHLDGGHPLEDIAEPNLLREQFPYTEVPKVVFDGKLVAIDPPRDIFITDTTFRDGQQARQPYTVQQIVDIYKLLSRLGGPDGVVRQCEFFLYTDKDREAVRKCQELGLRYPEITGWIRAVKSDFKLVRDMGLKETGILTSASDYHIFHKMKKTRKQALADYLDIARAAIEAGVLPRCHFEDCTRADIYGFIVPFAQALMRLAEEAKVPIKIRVCDTMGFGVPWPDAALPRGIPKLMHAFVYEAGVPKQQLEWHGHNDFHKTVVNATTAWLYGCAGANCALLGTGERTGNTPLEAMIFDYVSLRGDRRGIDTTVVTEIADYYRKVIHMEIPHNYPFVGSAFNVTMAGIHADGLTKDEEIYNIFDTKALLRRPIGVTINDKSGAAGVAYWVNHYLGLEGEQRIPKSDAAIAKIYEDVMAQYNAGRTTGFAPEEMVALGRKHLPQQFR